MNKVYSRIESITGSVITVRAEGVKYNELAEITTRFGKSLAEVNKIDGDVVSLQVFAGFFAQGHATSFWPFLRGAPTEWMQGMKLPSLPRCFSTASPVRVMMFMLTTTYGEWVIQPFFS